MEAPRCSGRKNDGTNCRGWRVPGSDLCRRHLPNPKARARAAVRAELSNWGLGTADIDPAETLLRLLSQSAARAQRYAAELEQLVAESPSLHEALVGTIAGEWGPAGEYVRGLASAEAQERDRCASFAAKAIAAGLAERSVRLAERQASIAERALLAALADLGLSGDQQQHATARLAHHLRLVG